MILAVLFSGQFLLETHSSAMIFVLFIWAVLVWGLFFIVCVYVCSERDLKMQGRNLEI